MGGQHIKTVADKIANIQLQTSTYGLGLAIQYGTNRGAGNLLWYGNFQAIPHSTTTTGGKGLGKVTTQNVTYTYTASVIMALGEGPITGIGTVWKGKDQSTLTDLGLTLVVGNSGQAPWSFLSGYAVPGNWSRETAIGYNILDPSTGTYVAAPAYVNQALGYDTTAYLAASAYDLGGDATIPNHGFEIKGIFIVGSGNQDANPKDVVVDFLSNVGYGVGLAAGLIGSTTAYSQYCVASGLFISPRVEELKAARQYLQDFLDATNTDPLWSDGVLKLLPRGDVTVTGNGQTFTPNLTPVYDLDADAFTALQYPVRVTRSTPADAYNRVVVEFSNRHNQYNTEEATAEDQNAIEQYGLRTAPSVSAPFITEPIVAKLAAQLLLQKYLYLRNEYSVELTEAYALLEPGDLVTLTDPDQSMSRVLVKITQIEETEAGFQTKAEDMLVGTANAALYPHDSGLRWLQDLNVVPNSPAAPFIFELPADPTTTGLAIGIAAGRASGDPLYGGCNVWVSLDGTRYQQVGMINGSSRYGTLRSAFNTGASTMAIQMASQGQMPTVSATDASNGATMLAIGQEYLAYQTSTLVATDQYDLTGLVRPLYSTTAANHSSGDKWARVDDAICRIEDIDLSLIGKTIHVKLTAFNSYEGGQQALSAATDYTYTITGYMQALGIKAQLAKISDDGWLTPDEKIRVIQIKANADNEYTTITARAASLSVSTTGYATAKSNLDTYLAGLSPAWNDKTTATAITRSTWDTVWEAYYNTREIVLSNIDAATALVSTWAGTSGIPTPISDGRVGTALTSAGNLQTGVDGGGATALSVSQLMGAVSGTQLSANPEFTGGSLTGYQIYDNAAGGHTTISSVADGNAPNGSGYVMRMSYDGSGTPNTNPRPDFGGWGQVLNDSGAGSVSKPAYYARGTQILARIWAKIPVGRSIVDVVTNTGLGGNFAWLTPTAGTGAWALYMGIRTIGVTGTFSLTGLYYITGGANAAFSVDVAKHDQIDITSAPRTFAGSGGDLYDPVTSAAVTSGRLFNDQMTTTADTGGTGGRVRVLLNYDSGATNISSYQLPSAAQNLDITVTGNNIAGIGTGNNTPVANAGVSFTSGGALVGGGGGALTLTGVQTAFGVTIDNGAIAVSSGQITGIGTGNNTEVANSYLNLTSDSSGTGGRARVLLNRNLGSANLTTLQLPSVTQNLDITFSGNNLTGIGTGNNTPAANAGLSLAIDGSLVGGGGGQATPMGMGFSPAATAADNLILDPFLNGTFPGSYWYVPGAAIKVTMPANLGGAAPKGIQFPQGSGTDTVGPANGITDIVPGQTLWFSCWVYITKPGGGATNPQVAAIVDWLAPSGAYISSSTAFAKSASTFTLSTMTYIEGSVTAPSNAAQANTNFAVFFNHSDHVISMTALRFSKMQGGADRTREVQVTLQPPAGPIVIQRDSSGTVLANQLPYTVPTPGVTRNGASIALADNVSYSIANIVGGIGTVTINNTNGSSTKGNSTIPTGLTSSGSYQIIVTVDGIAQQYMTVYVNAQNADPTISSSSSGTTDISDSITGTSYVQVGNTIVGLVKGTGQKLYVVYGGSYYLFGVGTIANHPLVKAQYSVTGANSWTDFAAGVAGSDANHYPPASGIDNTPGNVTVNQNVTPANGTYDVRFVAAENTATGTITFQGETATAYVGT